MLKYEKYPEQAAASLEKSSDALAKADDELSEAIERQEAIETQMETADESEQPGLSERHRALEDEITALRHDFESADHFHSQNLGSWDY